MVSILPSFQRTTDVRLGLMRGVVAAVVAAALIVASLTSASAVGGRQSAAPPGADEKAAQSLDAFARMPLAFVENRGQVDQQVRYHADAGDAAFFFARDRVVLSLAEEGERDRLALALRFVGANPDVEPRGEGRAGGHVNYVRGADSTRWRTELTRFSTIVYPQLWPGIDMVLHGEGGALKYEFRVRPGARPQDIRLEYDGAEAVGVDPSGALRIETALGMLRDAAPVTYQDIGGTRVAVNSHYVVTDGGTSYGFQVGRYRPDRELVIDPALEYSTFLGGASMDRAEAMAVDANGNLVVVGVTQSTDFPATTGAVSRTFNGGIMDAYVAKLTADGSRLVYATYLGGTPTPARRGNTDNVEIARSVAVDGNGNAYVTGQTDAGDFPTTSGAFQTALKVGEQQATDGFVAKLGATGSLAYSTFLGGEAGSDDGRAIAVDGSGNAYVAGSTFSEDFPTTSGAFDVTQAGGEDVFVAKLNASGSALAYSTLLGGADNELSHAIAVDGAGNAYVSGSTRSVGFPSTPGVFQPAHSGGEFAQLFEAFVTKVSVDGSSLVYSTFLGGTRIDHGGELDIDSTGNVHVLVATQSPTFPTTPGAYDTVFDGTSEAAVVKLDPAGSELVYSTFFRGAAAIALDSDNNAWLGGGAGAGAATTADAFQSTNNGGNDGYVAQLDPTGSRLLYGTLIGGANSDGVTGIGLDAAENIYVAGTTQSTDFPTTSGAFDRAFSGNPSIFWGDAFAAKFTAGGTPPPADTIAPAVGISSPTADSTVSGTVSVTASASDEVGVTDVRFFVDGTPIGSDTSAPYSVPWNTTTMENGRHVLTATARDAAGNTGSSAEVTVTVDNAPPAPLLTSVTLSPTSVAGGDPSTGTVRLDSAAPTDGVSIALASSNAAAATVPASVTVPAGATSATFTVPTTRQNASTDVVVSARLDGITLRAVLTVTAPAPTTNTATFSGRVNRNRTVTHALSVGTGTVQVSLNWTNSRADVDLRVRNSAGTVVFSNTGSARPKAGSFPAPAGSYRFEVTNSSRRDTDYTLSVTHPIPSGATEATVDTAAPVISVSSPTAGSTVTGTASVTASATDNVGVTEVRFFADGVPIGIDPTSPYAVNWNTTAVADGSRELTARAFDAAANSTTSASVTVTVTNSTAGPGASQSPGSLDAPTLLSPADEARWAPDTSRTFDWTDVPGADTYTLQTSTSSGFTSIQLERTVTASQVVLSFSSEGTRYWRVRANDPNGNPGAWSASRSYRIKD